MTFLTDLDNLIKHQHGDVKKLRDIRDTIRHDNFITTDDKNYVQSLIEEYLIGQPLEQPSSRRKSNPKIKLEQRTKTKYSSSESNLSFNFSSNKKFGILGGAAAAIAIITILGFTSINQDVTVNSIISSTPNNPLLMNLDQNKYQRADIISISGDTKSSNDIITLSIENTNGIKIWKEDINPKNNGNFSTLVIAGGGGWENNGAYILKAVQNDLIKEIKFQIVS